MKAACVIRNGCVTQLAAVPSLTIEDFREFVAEGVRGGSSIAAMFGTREPEGSAILFAVLAEDSSGLLSLASARTGDSYPAVTPDCEQAHMFEREIAEQLGVTPSGHPWLKPVRYPLFRADGSAPAGRNPCGVADFFSMEGDEIHEVAVGPVHAGIIEPGHFRFQCHGERVLHLEISLGYQHRGMERAVVAGPDKRTAHYIETIAGDTTIGHTLAYSLLVEGLSGSAAPARAQVIRGLALELERMANHVGDLGALAGDIGYLPTMSYCGRIRGDLLNATADLCGNRFGRGLVRPGGVGYDVTDGIAERVSDRVRGALRDAKSAVSLLWNTPSVLARFEGTGTVATETARRIGLVGVAARASGLDADVRRDHPYGVYRFAHIPVAAAASGDVFARAWVRWQEVERSAAFVLEQLDAMPRGEEKTAGGRPAADSMGVSLVEGWRGRICHVAVTDGAGRLACYKMVDPSFLNWFGLACAMRGQEISDFPLCNKSFNLSYCGHDL